MKPSTTNTAMLDIVKTPYFAKIAAITFISFTAIILFSLLPSFPSVTISTASIRSSSTATATNTTTTPPTNTTTSSISPPHEKSLPPLPPKVEKRTGIVDETGAMTEEFEIGEFDPSSLDELRNLIGGKEEKKRAEENDKIRFKYEKYSVCEESKREYIPCLDNVEEIKRLNLSNGMEKYERHCPEEGKGLDCLVPMPKGYQRSIPWPKSRDEVICYADNV